MKIDLSDIKISPIYESVHREKMSDERYFSDEFSDYISNSRLKLINPKDGGSPSKYKAGFTGEFTNSLAIGSAVHCLLLQGDTFVLGPDINKPSAKLGLVIDKIREYRIKGYTVNESINKACLDIHYYEKNINPSRIKSIIKSGFEYYKNCKYILDDHAIILSSKDREIVKRCLNNLNTHRVKRILNPIDLFGEEMDSFNEEAFFINLIGKYKDKECEIKLKMKADNWTLDIENKIVTLNDLKTTGHSINTFMEKDGSFYKFSYYRQFALYLWIILQYCKKELAFKSDEWIYKCNVIVVETIQDNKVGIFPISKELLDYGRTEFCKLLKMVAYCEMFGYDDNIEFC